jgi:hypothetical protein
MSLTILYFLHTQWHVQISQRLPINVPNHLLYFLHMHHHVQKARGSIGMCSRFSIWLTKFSKVFTPIINGLARPLNPQARLLVFIETRGSKWAWDGIYHDRSCWPRLTHKLHRLTTGQLAPYHDGRIDERRSTTYYQYTNMGFSHLVYLKYL